MKKNKKLLTILTMLMISTLAVGCAGNKKEEAIETETKAEEEIGSENENEDAEEVKTEENTTEELMENLISEKIDLTEFESYGWADGYTMPIMKNGLWGLADYQGNIILEPAYAESWYFPNENGYAIFHDAEGFYIVGSDGVVHNYPANINQIRIGEENIVSYEVLNGDSNTAKSSVYETLDGTQIYRLDYTYDDYYIDDYYGSYAVPFNDGKAYICKTQDGKPVLVELSTDGTQRVLDRHTTGITGSSTPLAIVPTASYADGYFVAKMPPVDGVTLFHPDTLERTEVLSSVDAGIFGISSDCESFSYMQYYVNGNGIKNSQNYGCLRVTLSEETTKDVLFDYFSVTSSNRLEKCIAVYDEILFDDHDYLAVRNGAEWFYIDCQGNVVSESYKDATPFNDEGYALVLKEDGKAYVINQAFEALGHVGEATDVAACGELFKVDNTFAFYYGEQYLR